MVKEQVIGIKKIEEELEGVWLSIMRIGYLKLVEHHGVGVLELLNFGSGSLSRVWSDYVMKCDHLELKESDVPELQRIGWRFCPKCGCDFKHLFKKVDEHDRQLAKELSESWKKSLLR